MIFLTWGDSIMSHKISAARRAAFLEALAETGNQTIAAERAKVSRSWVCLHRAADPAFDAAVRAAIESAKARLRGSDGRAPPSGWGFLDGEELVVKGTGGSALRDAAGAAPQDERKKGRRVQIARARLKQWTPRIEERFLAALGATCNVKAACAEVGMSASSAYEHRKRWPAFARRWDEAVKLGCIQLEFALVAYCCNPFSVPDPPALPPVEIVEPAVRIDYDRAMRGLYMQQHRVYGMGRPPGRCRKQPRFEEARRVILRKVEAIERGGALSEEDKARREAEFALRRRSG